MMTHNLELVLSIPGIWVAVWNAQNAHFIASFEVGSDGKVWSLNPDGFVADNELSPDRWGPAATTGQIIFTGPLARPAG